MARSEHEQDPRHLLRRTPELQGRPRGQELASRAWEAIARAEQHMASSAQRLDRSQLLLRSGTQRLRSLAQRVNGSRGQTSTVGEGTVSPETVGPDIRG